VLYVGIVHSVRWDSNREPDNPSLLTAVFGNTTAEANAALHSAFAAPNARSAFGMQLHALLTGQLDRLHEPGGEQRALRQFHQQRFSPASSAAFGMSQMPPTAQTSFPRSSPASRNSSSPSIVNNVTASYAAKRQPLPNSWRPVDPVLLLQGPDVKPAMRFGGDGELLCQVFGTTPENSFLSALDLPTNAVPGVGPARLDTAHDTPTLAPQIEKLDAPKAALTAAALEALLLWPAWAGAALAERAGKPNSSADIAAWLAARNPEQSGSP
jgi:hypothetical protein